MLSTRIIIPTRNAADYLPVSLPILTSVVAPDQILIIDSASRDRTLEIAREFGVQVHSIDQSKFNHGDTRNLGRQLGCAETDVLIYMTQDAIPVDGSFLTELLKPFEDENVGMVYGRQLPVPGAEPLEAFPRLFNYPAESLVKSESDLSRLGIKTFFCSDSFCAYRTRTWDKVGGFPQRVIVGEDQHIAARMIQAGHKIAYAATAQVYHSHCYTLMEEFRRYFDIGAFHSYENWILQAAGAAEGEGLRFLKAQTAYLWETGKGYLLPYSLVATIVKYMGYRAGLAESRLPYNWKLFCSQQKYFWQQPNS